MAIPESRIVEEGRKLVPQYIDPRVNYEINLSRILEAVNRLGVNRIRDKAIYLIQLGIVEEAKRKRYSVTIDGANIKLRNSGRKKWSRRQ